MRRGSAPSHLALLLEPDGHIDFGVLGVFLDMAGSQAGPMRPFVHADISIQRIARPVREKVFIDARTLRAGKRTSSVQVEAFDELGTRVADSTRQVSYRPLPEAEGGNSGEANGRAAEMRRRFREPFDARVQVYDDGQETEQGEPRLCILGEVHTSTIRDR